MIAGRLSRTALVASLVLLAALSSGALKGSASTTSASDDRGGVPPGYPLNLDVVAPLIITTMAPDPIPVTGTHGRVHVVYELKVLNDSPRLATITKIDTLADGPDGEVVATLGREETQARSLLIANFESTPVIIGLPLSGKGWDAGNGCCGLTSHRGAMAAVGGRLNGSERFAIDWVRFDLADDPLRTFHGDSSKNQDYLAYDADILDVVDGTVVSVVSDMADELPKQAPELEIDELGSNHIILDIGSGNYAFYAHLIPGSPKVRVGDHVTRGQVIGKVGNSGNTTDPHLHFNVSRAPLPLSGDNVPYVINRFSFVGSLSAASRLVAGPDAGARTMQILLNNNIIDFQATS